jgi:hypothetical protein
MAPDTSEVRLDHIEEKNERSFPGSQVRAL